MHVQRECITGLVISYMLVIGVINSFSYNFYYDIDYYISVTEYNNTTHTNSYMFVLYKYFYIFN